MRNALSKTSYIMLSIYVNILGYILFDFLFAIIEQHSIREVNWRLITLVLAVYFTNLLLAIKWDRSEKSIFTTMIAAYSIYAFLFFWKYDLKLCIATYIFVGLILVMYILLIYCRKTPPTKSKRQIFKFKLRRCYVGVKKILSWGGTILIVILFVVQYFHLGEEQPDNVINEENEQVVEKVDAEDYFFANIDSFLKLQPKEWKKLDKSKKIDVLEKVKNYEMLLVGIGEEEILLEVVPLEGNIQGVSKNGLIQIDMEHLSEAGPELIYNTLAHEVFHASQYRFALLYNSLNLTEQNLVFLQDGKVYCEEFKDYINGQEQYSAYYSQKLESDARAYAARAWLQMNNRIQSFINNQEQPKVDQYKEDIAYNQYGDKIYCVIESENEVYITTWDYKYDDEGRMIYSYEVHKAGDSWVYYNKEKFYTYNENSQLIEVMENYKETEKEYQTTITYEYDEFGQVIREEETTVYKDDKK